MMLNSDCILQILIPICVWTKSRTLKPPYKRVCQFMANAEIKRVIINFWNWNHWHRDKSEKYYECLFFKSK